MVTVVVFAITATTSVAQLLIPGMLGALQRSSAGLHGDWWRTVTALFVQDGGVAGTIVNLAFLLVIGALADQVLDTRRWLTCYVGAGLAGELVGYAWQPDGAGNSVAICGLAGALAVALWRGDARVPRLAPMVVLYWCGGLLGALFWPGLVLCMMGGGTVQFAVQRGRSVDRPVAAAVAAVAVILLAATDIHGAALVAGMTIAVAVAGGVHPDRATRKRTLIGLSSKAGQGAGTERPGVRPAALGSAGSAPDLDVATDP